MVEVVLGGEPESDAHDAANCMYCNRSPRSSIGDYDIEEIDVKCNHTSPETGYATPQPVGLNVESDCNHTFPEAIMDSPQLIVLLGGEIDRFLRSK